MTFTKLFSSITASTVWCESSDTRVVWITMLAMADRHGRVWASIPGLAKEAAVSVDAARTAITKFLSPDPDSRTKVAEGRRIEPIDGGWKLINHAKYRAIRDEEERKSYKATKQREYRAKAVVDNVDICGTTLNSVDSGAHNAEAEAYTEAETEAGKNGRHTDSGSELALAAWLFEEANVPCDNAMVKVGGDCIRKLAREIGISYKAAADIILEAARRAIIDGDRITRFWLTDQQYKPQEPKKSARQKRIENWSADD